MSGEPSPSSSSDPTIETLSISSEPAADTELVAYDFHVSHPTVTELVAKQCQSLKEELMKEPICQQQPDLAEAFLTQQNLHRYLRARAFDFVKSKKLMLESLTWRVTYRPELISAAEVEAECNTGKIRVLPQLDRHHRPIIVMDSSRENSKNHDSQIKHLVWQLERAKRKMNVPVASTSSPTDKLAPPTPPTVEKYCVFINMERNSIWNSPPLKTSLETLKTLTDRYPEHLGHAIIYKPGMLFAGLWAACKPLMDVKTVRKVVFIRGDVSEGSKNDTILKEIIHDQWKQWCDVPKDDYDHAQFWPQVLADEAAYHERTKASAAATDKPKESSSNGETATPVGASQ